MAKEKAVSRGGIEPVCYDIWYVNIYQRFAGKELARLIRMIDHLPQIETSEERTLPNYYVAGVLIIRGHCDTHAFDLN
jgi:hypothetical protein